jgi:hypothetical protein
VVANAARPCGGVGGGGGGLSPRVYFSPDARALARTRTAVALRAVGPWPAAPRRRGRRQRRRGGAARAAVLELFAAAALRPRPCGGGPSCCGGAVGFDSAASDGAANARDGGERGAGVRAADDTGGPISGGIANAGARAGARFSDTEARWVPALTRAAALP